MHDPSTTTLQSLLAFSLAVLLTRLATAQEAAPATPSVAPPAVGTPAPGRYPTAALADYVLGCMIANGQSPYALQKCACSIDFIAAAIPYEEYERVETLMRLQQSEGTGRTAAYKGTSWAKDAVARFKDVQAESTLHCF